MSKCKYIQAIQPQVRFGVDLREIFPPWYLHPALKNLMYLAEINIRNRQSIRFDIEEIIGKNSKAATMQQKLEFKEMMMSGKNILDCPVAPGVPIWIIRHFIGLLPTPLFSYKPDPNYWMNFCTRYFEQFIESIKTRKSTNDLKYTIAFELSHLPSRNITFLFELFDLLRFLSSKTLSDSSEMIDKHAALLLVKYFTPSLFVRPYRPGISMKSDRKYVSLILYIIHFWPNIRNLIHDILISSHNKNESKFFYFPEHYYYNKYSENNDYLKDIGTQTNTYQNFVLDKKDSDFDSIIDGISEITFTNYDKKQDIPCDKKHSKTSIVNTKITSWSTPELKTIYLKNKKMKENNRNPHKLVTTTSLSSRKTSIIYLNNFRRNQKCQITSKKVHKNFRPLKQCDIIVIQIPYRLRRLRRRNVKTIKFKNTSSKSVEPVKKEKINPPKVEEIKNDENKKLNETEFSLNSSELNLPKYERKKSNNSFSPGEFIYDTFIGKCLSDPKSTKNPFKTDLTSSTYIDYNSPIRSVDLYEGLTHYGWTYSQSNITPKPVDPYRLCFDPDQNSLSPLADVPQSVNDSINLDKQNNKFISSLKKVGSRLNFFKFITKKSLSFEDISSQVKYEKILKSSNSI